MSADAHCRPRAAAGARPAYGSASIEFVIMIPFVLVLLVLILDLHAYIGHRTALVREMYVVAEVLANDVGTDSASPVERVVGQAREALQKRGAGRISVAVVVRGDRRDPTAASPDADCDDDANWCLPRVVHVWPPPPPHADAGNGTWGTGACQSLQTELPGAGRHFALDQRVLSNEGAAPQGQPPPSHETWVSRNMGHNDWWVLVETCLHADAGLFGGSVLRGLEYFDVSDSAFVWNRRAAWGSIHDLDDCKWCEP